MSGMRKRIELSPDVRDNKRVRYSEDGMAVTNLSLSPLGKKVTAATEMEGQMENSYLLEMPTLVIEKILSNVLNLSNVSQTCKALYDAVCQMEKRRRVACIIRFVKLDGGFERLTIDDDVVYDSIMNSRRTITNIQLDGGYSSTGVQLNEPQLERLTAVMKHFGANITSLVLRCVTLSIDKIIGLLNKTPKLESLEFEYGRAFGRATGSLDLTSLKKLSITNFHGLLEIVDCLPSGSLNDFSCSFGSFEERQPEILQTLLSKQHNLKSLQINDHTDLAVLRVNHLQLEKLELRYLATFNNDQLVEMLKCHTNLKELRLEFNYISVAQFEWICDNLSELEVLQVNVQSPGQNTPSMLRKLKNLRDFSTPEMHFLPDDKFQFRNDSLAKLRIRSISWSSNEEFNQIVRSIARTFTNLTALDIRVKDFSELSAVLCQCTTLIHLTTSIEDPIPYQLGEKRFPNIRHFTFGIFRGKDEGISLMLSIVGAMPNLKSLWMQYSEVKFNIKAFKEFIHASKSLEELKLDCVELDHDWCVTDDFVETFRRLCGQLKAYRLTFGLYGRLNLNPINDILSNEFNVRDYYESGDDVSFVLFKGVLSKFRGYP